MFLLSMSDGVYISKYVFIHLYTIFVHFFLLVEIEPKYNVAYSYFIIINIIISKLAAH